jgi:hypothetical protein
MKVGGSIGWRTKPGGRRLDKSWISPSELMDSLRTERTVGELACSEIRREGKRPSGSSIELAETAAVEDATPEVGKVDEVDGETPAGVVTAGRRLSDEGDPSTLGGGPHF